ncbi:DEAD/DEAH box helicase [Legionella erythra]|uniref:SNF2/RAD54 family transporter domain-containing protein n=1 Tax=Legionella erythra TaxID=448 RepID=A0A0W0TJG7_LEGER|nr:DEAD/DEAH box helicase [Legionella erythra]KTC95712.1 SNF2/RAD54 family transporter domain-containing protein [Legionella erythra]
MLKDALSRMADVFLPSVLMHGQDYQQRGFVLNIRLSDGLLKARVKGRSHQIYDVHIDLKAWPAKPAHCTCSYAANCKHAAASLLALQIKEQITIPAPASEKPGQTLNEWLHTLRDQQPSVEQTGTHVVTYLLSFEHGPHEDLVMVRLALAKRLKRRSLGKMNLFTTVTESRRQFFTEDDEDIIAQLQLKGRIQGNFERLPIRNSELLEKIIKTQRAYRYGDEERLLHWGDSLKPKLHWQLEKDGHQRPVLMHGQETLNYLFLDKLWYIDPVGDECGLINIPVPLAQLKQILSMPPVALEAVGVVIETIRSMNDTLPLPNTFPQRQIRRGKPRGIVRFDAAEQGQSLSIGNQQPAVLFYVHLAFDYSGFEFKADDPCYFTVFEEGQHLIRLERDFALEKQQWQDISQILNLRKASVDERLSFDLKTLDLEVLSHYHQEDDLARLYQQVIPLLKSKQWQVEFLHPVYEEIVDEEQVEWYSDFKEQGNDFFSYQLGILVGGKPVNIVPVVAALINQWQSTDIQQLPDDQMVKLSLANGKALRVNLGRIKPLVNFLIQYGTRSLHEGDSLTISRHQLILIRETEQALAAAALRWHGGEKIRMQLQKLVDLSRLEQVKPPAGLRAMLRDYQQQGLNWLQLLRESRLGGVLADDMGLGKTVQTLAHMQLEKEQGRLQNASLIVAPTSLVVNWFEEAKRFTPELKVLIFHGQERHQDEFDGYDLVISTYGLIQRDKSRFVDYPFYYLILDEAQSIKNARAKTTQIIQQVKATHRLCLSGTPLENHLGELWSLFHFLMPGLLGDARQFRRFFKTPIEKDGDEARRELLAARVRPFMLRRNKNQVASELPPKTEMVRLVELAGNQRDLYEAIRISMEKKVRDAIARQGMGKSHIVLLDALLKLRQVCCDPRLLPIPGAAIAHGFSAKLDALLDLLDNLVDEGRRILVFSQFTSMLKLIEEQLDRRRYAYLKLTGQTQNRQELVNQFQQGQVPIFLISLKAGGTGLNLTRADTVIHYDPWWNPAAEEQATDRSHRIGQENPVFVYKLITRGTVEEAILAMQSRKRALFEGILADNSSRQELLTDQDLDVLFTPLDVE